MYRNLLFPLSVVLLFAVASSCSNADKNALPVPKDAGFVLHINSPSISSKLSWQEIKETNLFKELYADAPDSLAKKLLDNPDNSGIDVQADMVFFMKRRGRGGYMVFEGTIKDAAAFESFNRKVSNDAATVKNGDLSIINNKEAVITWNADRFVYVIDAPFANMSSRYAPGMDDSGEYGPARFPYDSLVVFARELYSLKGSNSLADDKKYASLIKEAGDIHLWVSAEHMYGGMFSDMLSMMKVGILLEGNISAATLNFENGKISMRARNYYNDEVGKVYEKYKLRNFDAEALGRIPSQNVIAAFAMNYPPEGLKEFMKVIGVDGFVNGFMGDIGYSVDEFVKANKGDILITVSDFTLNAQQVTIPGDEEGGEGYTYTTTTPDMKVLFGAAVNDKAAFDKLISVLKEKVGEIPEGNGIPKISYSINDKWFAAGNSQEQVNAFLTGGSNKQPFISKISGHPVGFYVDIKKILQVSDASITDSTSSSKKAIAESLNMWEDIIMTGGEIQDGAWITNVEVNLVDKSTNSLKQLNRYVDRMAATQKRGF